MSNFLKKCAGEALAAIGVIFTFVPETLLEKLKILNDIKNDDIKTLIIRFAIYIIVLLIIFVFHFIYLKKRTKVIIKGNNYCIQIQYDDIFQVQNCKKIISFDECFTTDVGDEPHKIKPSSICGQYLTTNPSIDINTLI